MPSLKCTKLSHLQAILQGKKKAVKQSLVPARKVPNWPELSVKNLYREAILLANVADYLPDPTGTEENLRLPERDFFWKILSALHPDQVEDWIKEAANLRKPKSTNLQEERWQLGVTEE